ncbi:hypothetical protein [Rhizobium redzepovicii]|uniref:hypothetical protein n=1 Tax=Rhizobium redzepovicii TaxID=2867518 RepID=UPI0028728D38|nr:hypothetical protein [Rhizobium redzepovicii]MDR9779598.1 hypothetical protein [Rhizobium redzepovicii]
MVFEVSPDFIKTLDSVMLVRLMKRLMLAECRLTDIPLRAASVPLQVTVPDGGEDGRVEWTGGVDSTAYFPHRLTLFQSKAQDLTEGRIRGEILKKAKGGKTTTNDAVLQVLSGGGAYVVFCSHPMIQKKRDKLVAAIRKAITDGGDDPNKAAAIEIYDANRIADWVFTHPALALWLASYQRGRSVGGFQSHEGWGKSAGIHDVPWVPSDTPRYVPVNRNIEEAERKDDRINAWSFNQCVQACLDGLEDKDRIIRVVGPSGFGKSRLVYQMLTDGAAVDTQVATRSVIYADYSLVEEEVLKLALEIADSGSNVILVVDDCPDDVHRKLADSAGRAGSQLRLITINVETKFTNAKGTITLRLERADDANIEAIAKSAAPALRDADSRFIAELANGFPQMAVLGAQQGDGRDIINSAEQVLDRVIWGGRTPNDEAQKALETLSLFEWVGFKGQASAEAAFVAEKLASMPPAQFTDLILGFRARGIIDVRGSFFQVLPVPLAARLGESRLGRLSPEALISFFSDAPEELKSSLLRRMRWLDNSPTAKAFARALLAPECLGNLAALNTEFGAKCFDRLIHVDPDRAAETIHRVLSPLTNDELKAIRVGRSYLTWALEKLAFRAQSFTRAATLLRRLAASETDDGYDNGASGHFKQLYQLYLSGTEADPATRLLVLEEGMRSPDAAEHRLCVGALESMLMTSHFSRSGSSDEIGSSQRLEDWLPKTYSELWDFHRAGLSRLTDFVVSDGPYSGQAKKGIARHLRGLLSSIPYEDARAAVMRIVAHAGVWADAIEAVASWLYFDARKNESDQVSKVRTLFDELVPDDPVERVVVYTHGWPADLHDPDSRYDRSPGVKHDFEYSAREAAKLAPVIAQDSKMLDRTLDALCSGDGKNVFGFARELARSNRDPVAAFKRAVEYLDNKPAQANRQLFGGLIAGTDDRDSEAARECVRLALQTPKLSDYAISMIGSGKLQPADLAMVISLLESGDVEPWQCVTLSYGQRLNHLSANDLQPLLDALKRMGAPGLWAAIEIVFMYLYDGRSPTRTLIRTVKSILLSRDLFGGVNRGTMDGHYFHESVSWLAKHNAADDKFACAMTKQLVRLARFADSDIFFALDDPARAILQNLIKSHPREVWGELSREFDGTDPMRRHRLGRLLQQDREDWLGAGTLFELPRELYIDWIRAKPSARAALAVSWLPVAIEQRDGSLAWHPAMAAFVEEFGDQPNVLRALSDRLRPSTWSGSLAGYLEPLVPLVSGWLAHSSPAVRAWAAAALDGLRRRIDYEREDDEDPYRP